MSAYLDLVDPELRDAAQMMRENMAAYTPMDLDKLAQRRRWMEDMRPEPLAGVPFTEHRISRANGPDVSVLVVNAKPGEQRPGVFHMHGGGFTASTAVGGLPAIQQLARDLDIPIVTVEYRLAPETIWSGSLDDNYTALLWTVRHAAELGIDPARIALMGESAGGGHAALLALAARDRGEVQPALQCLIYPMIDDRSGTSRQVPEHIGYFGWNPAANLFGWRSFLGCEPGGDDVPREAVPSRCEDLSGLPPTFIACGTLDLFVEEDIAFAGRLICAGVPTELLIVPGAFHGFDSFAPEAAISRRFRIAKIEALKRGLELV
ncbi:MAG: alpha/beta hydrolase, partial [Sphingomonadales bacterium]|nr:alpha/beta hydrolase [Sphingomonadales bacterium]